MNPLQNRSLLAFFLLSITGLTACFLCTAGIARAADPSAARNQPGMVKPLDWLKAQKAPDFAPRSTLPPLTRWGWAMSFDVAKELANHWG